MPLKQQKKLLILGIYTINFIRNEILSDYYALLIDSSLRPISQSLVHKICMHLNLHSRYTSDEFSGISNIYNGTKVLGNRSRQLFGLV